MTKIFGITGGIGSGKTFICQALQQLGFKVYFSDVETKRLMNENNEVKIAIINLLGNDAYKNDILNTKHIANKVFNSPTLLQQLNTIVHPAVKKDIVKWASNSDEKFVFVESAILFESHFDEICSGTIAITAPENIRLERAMKRDHVLKEQINVRMKAQLSDEERSELAGLTIVNDGVNDIKTITKTIIDYAINL